MNGMNRAISIQKGIIRPHSALTTMAMAYYQNAANYFAKTMFPICPVPLSSDNYYIFNKEDLLRDNWHRKPETGTVSPAVLSESTEQYACHVDQMRISINQIRQTDLNRRLGPATANTKQQRTKAIAEQRNIHQDKLFANAFFKEGVWGNEWEGVDGNATGKQFIKFSDDNSEPIKLVHGIKTEILQETGREANRLGMGINVFNALKEHPAILERIKYGGTTANPAQVTERVLAELFGVEKLVVLKSIHNNARLGEEANMQFIGDPNAFLLTYAPNTPSIDEPSAGYIFTWDMLGNGQYMPIMNYPDADPGNHVEWIEGLMATDMKKTSDDLAVFFKNAV